MAELNIANAPVSSDVVVQASPAPRELNVNVAPVATTLAISATPVVNSIEVNVAPVTNDIEIIMSNGAVGPQGPAGDDYFGVFFNDFTINRNGDGLITSIDYANSVTVTFNRDVDGVLTSLTDGVKTKTLNRDINGVLTGITFS